MDASNTLAATLEDIAQQNANKHAEMELLLLAAPKSIALLAQLTLLATSITDSSLTPLKDGFKFIKYGDSFRACLHQLVNNGYESFNLAQTNIQKISKYSARIPDCIADIISCLLEGAPEDIAEAIPTILEEIEKIATNCIQLADSSEQKFEQLIQLSQELSEARATSEPSENTSQEPPNENSVDANNRGHTRTVSVLLDELSSLDIQNIGIAKVRGYLQEGLQALSTVRAQWKTLVQFYHTVARVIKVAMQESLAQYTTTLEAAQKRIQTGRALSAAAKDSLHFHAIHISTVAFHVHMISNTYWEVSSKHLLHRVLHLGELISTDPSKDQAKIKQLQRDIHSGCISSQKDIEESAARNRDNVLSVYRTQMEKLRNSVKGISSEQHALFLKIISA